MYDLQGLLHATASRHHNHLCPRQVLGVRMGLFAGELLALDLPQNDKRLFTFVETDGCLTDGIAVATGCWWGSRTMYLMDYGKSAATFVDTLTEAAVRIWPSAGSRKRAVACVPDAPDRWHAQLAAYQTMPTEDLLLAQRVTLTVSLTGIISQHGKRIVCERCGEDVINERWATIDGERICRACAQGAYYSEADGELSVPNLLATTESGG
ncbi:MAG: FmdE family protein [Chloroflexi bacterium]|nr:FmdE family protein [Chloroflexota bacterium]